MRSRSVTLLDVCSGNVRSVARALTAVGADVTVTSEPATVRAADRLVVPGQGAFGTFMQALDTRGLRAPLMAHLEAGRPYLGICLGMQVLFDASDEQGPVAGLGRLAGHVRRFAPADARLKVPHMGWNQVRARGSLRPGSPLAAVVDADAYFVHSYYCVPTVPGLGLDVDYGVPFCAALEVDELVAVQFHPEKSQAVGLALLRGFVGEGARA